ncbi:hypothetical protein F4678DRAFT_478458 [Xylaria arbuscula]|nr:hypothetical protein F4678DRAFT_478458 [Xylaria arbuscula]
MKINGLVVFSTFLLSSCLSNAAPENGAVAAVGQGDASNAGVDAQGDVIGNNSAVANAGNAADQNQDQNGSNNVGQSLNGTLGGGGSNNINIDPNDIQGSLGQNILDLLLSMGVSNFNLNSLGGLGIGDEIQLFLQLQQLQQLQSLGIINSATIDQLLQQEILSQNFNLSVIKRNIDASLKRAARGRKRTVT